VGGSVSLEETALDPRSNGVIQAAIIQSTHSDIQRFEMSEWGTVTAVRGDGRQKGFVSTPTKGIPNSLTHALAQQVGILDTRWRGRDLRAGLEGPKEDFYDSTAVTIAGNVPDGWHAGPDNSDTLANEVTHLMLAKFGQKVADQMTKNLTQGRRSFICRQLHWVGGYSVDWLAGDDASDASIEPNIMIGVIVVVDDELDLQGSTLIYSAFGPTPLPDFKEGMRLPAQEGARLLAPYVKGHELRRSYTSMCTEVTLASLAAIERDEKLQASIALQAAALYGAA
jgi:hypothetical protein